MSLMSLTDNIRDVSLVNQYSVNKVVRIFTGQYTSGQLTTRVGDLGTIYVYRIPHNLPRPVTCDLITSTDGGTTWDMGINKLAFSDNTYIYIFHGFSASGPVDYKVYCSWIDNYDSSDPSIEAITYGSNPVQFDSRLNYQKIHSQGVTSFTPGTFGATEVDSVNHSLGYTPNAKVYFEAFSGEVWPLNIGGARNPFLYDGSQDECQCEIWPDRIDITLSKFSNTTKRAWYRIYYDAD